MAVSKLLPNIPNAKLLEINKDGLAILENSLHCFQNGLKQFRACHDLCLTNNLLHTEASDSLNQCAILFRQLSSSVASLAEKIASLWCKTCGLLYKNFEKIGGNPSKILLIISQQAEDFSKGFEAMVQRVDTLTDKFGSIQGYSYPPVQQQLVHAFQEKSHFVAENESKLNVHLNMIAKKKEETTKRILELQDLIEKLQQELQAGFKASLKSSHAETRKNFKKGNNRPDECDNRQQELESGQKDWKRCQEELKNYQEECSRLKYALEDYEDQEEKYQFDLKAAENEVKQSKATESQAQIYAEELKILMGNLTSIKSVSSEMVKYWNKQQEYYSKLSIITDPSELKKVVKPEEIQKQTETLPKIKEKLENFHKYMVVVSNSFNFAITLHPEAKHDSLFLSHLKLWIP